ncbi:MAG TPA: hypothetical protein VK479_14765 [Micropepsaceae bacterium]|nr:hypothetical protein [Micropepsaceae bacterium]
MDPVRPVPIAHLRGLVAKGDYGKGSKSERQAVFIDTSDGRYILRRKTGPAFDDAEIERYIGHTVECDGFLVGTTVLAERIQVIS